MAHSEFTDITVVLDKSGSMGSVAEATASGFDEFVQEQKKAPGKAVLTLVQFDISYDITHNGMAIEDVPKLKYSPGGMTALLDAVGRAVTEAKARIKGLDKDKRPDKVVFCIITDGHENSSKEYSRDAVKALVEKRTKKGWEFLFLGANIDAMAEAQKIGVSGAMAANYAGTSKGTRKAFRSTGDKVYAARASGQSVSSYTDDERDDLTN